MMKEVMIQKLLNLKRANTAIALILYTHTHTHTHTHVIVDKKILRHGAINPPCLNGGLNYV